MPVSRRVAELMKGSSWIRRMFEEGARLKAAHGAENVFDFSLGNPVLEPPPEVVEAFRAALDEPAAGTHRYMPNAGYPKVREAVAEFLTRDYGVPFAADRLLMCTGAGGGLNVVLKSILDPGDEVLVVSPWFPEYQFYVDNHGGRMVAVPAGPGFLPDPAALEAAAGPRTAAVLLNTPNNPTGVVYGQETLDAVGEALRRASARTGRVIHLVSDEPYRRILFDGRRPASVFRAYGPTILVTSHSKDLAIPGERIGVVAIGPDCPDGAALAGAFTFANRVLGFVNAPALQQRAVARLQGLTVDPRIYERKRDLLCGALQAAGYEVVRPGGAFYLFPRAPGGDDLAFVNRLLRERILVVPGSGFGAPGHFRVAYCVEDREIEGAIPGFARCLRDPGA
ncbi:MAG: pyridoxal phosphate-dependent aminotransferase [Planctomycetaceae bacterium]|nr:pyridoxal phosphate-dependent aminotransferase [Planctomycetota bacterium]NUN51328.1 pyridoxal phosphate-dependent aminotransferase [Planctomycetaceae bacterium]